MKPSEEILTFVLQDGTGKVHDTKRMTRGEAKKLNNCIDYLDCHYVGRDAVGFWNTGDYEWIVEKMKENNEYKKFIGKRK